MNSIREIDGQEIRWGSKIRKILDPLMHLCLATHFSFGHMISVHSQAISHTEYQNLQFRLI